MLNLVRAILWKSPDGVFRATAREAAGGRWNLLIIETQAVRHRLDRLLSEVGQDYQQDASAEASYTRIAVTALKTLLGLCLLYTSPSPRDRTRSRMPSSACKKKNNKNNKKKNNNKITD